VNLTTTAAVSIAFGIGTSLGVPIQPVTAELGCYFRELATRR